MATIDLYGHLRILCVTLLILFCIPTTLAQPIGDTFRGIPIREENQCSPYRGQDYSYPQSVEPQITIQQGGLFSPYDMKCFLSLWQVDIEHIVARSEAHSSGLCSATDEVRKEFSEDILNLTHATRALNQSKAAYDAADWLPRYNRCWFAQTVVEVKRKYGLTVDPEEAHALSRILQNCPDKEMIRPICIHSVPTLPVSN